MLVAPTVGVLLVNIGTPRSPAVADVRTYLREFLADPRVVDLPALGRWLLLNLVILPFRPKQSAHAYRQIWTPRGSPLLTHGLDLAAGVQEHLGERAIVRLAMRYGEPRIADAVDAFVATGVEQIVAVPLFPHQASASWGSAAAAVMQEAGRRWTVPPVHVTPPFWREPEFLATMAARIRQAIDRERPGHLVLSYHGVPERHVMRADGGRGHCLASPDCCAALGTANAACYRAQCFATSRALCQRLDLQPEFVTTTFQSRLGRAPWVRPHTDATLDELARKGVKTVAVATPAFVADCLETLEEIGIRARDAYATRGGRLVLVPSLNADADWCRALAGLLRRTVPELA
jgi:ferrochelatase